MFPPENKYIYIKKKTILKTNKKTRLISFRKIYIQYITYIFLCIEEVKEDQLLSVFSIYIVP